MAVQFVGFNGSGPSISATGLSGGIDTAPADGDWILWFVYYPNGMALTFVDSTGWTQLRHTVGAVGAIELWRYHWATGDPTSWTVNMTGFDGTHLPGPATIVIRGAVSAPTLLSTTHETTSPPVLIDTIVNSGIGNNDVDLILTALNTGRVDLPFGDGFSSGTTPNVCAVFLRLTVAGSAPSHSLGMVPATPTPTELFGLQLVVPDVPIPPPGGWGVGQIRMSG